MGATSGSPSMGVGTGGAGRGGVVLTRCQKAALAPVSAKCELAICLRMVLRSTAGGWGKVRDGISTSVHVYEPTAASAVGQSRASS